MPNGQKITIIQLTEMKIQLIFARKHTCLWRALYDREEITQEQEPTSIHQIFINVILYNYIHWKTYYIHLMKRLHHWYLQRK